ncbi:MAG: hypothetical protein NWF06_01855, partial [Candidatus Bathyarchaeota archaeon]|nr:hypothetical protein [Candidatus Bathyarchaeum sp.]
MSGQQELSFDGSDFDQELDGARLTGQIGRVYDVMKDENERSVKQIQDEIFRRFSVLDPENSIQAQLRNLRKPRGKFQGFNVKSYRKEGGLFVYVLIHDFWSREEVPEVIKKPSLLVYGEDVVRLSRSVSRGEWREIDRKLWFDGYTYVGDGVW